MEIIPPETGQYPSLTYKYANGVLLQVVDWRLEKQKHFDPQGLGRGDADPELRRGLCRREGWIHVGREGYLKSYPAEILQQGVGPVRVPPGRHRPSPELAQLHPLARAAGVRRGHRSPLHDGRPPRLHRPLDRTGGAAGTRPGRSSWATTRLTAGSAGPCGRRGRCDVSGSGGTPKGAGDGRGPSQLGESHALRPSGRGHPARQRGSDAHALAAAHALPGLGAGRRAFGAGLRRDTWRAGTAQGRSNSSGISR